MQLTSTDKANNLYKSYISSLDILGFMKSSWKALAVSTLVGSVLGLVHWYIEPNYTAEYVLFNRLDNGLNLAQFKTLQRNLPSLASRMIDESKAPKEFVPIYKQMSKDRWWQNHLRPSYVLNKSDIKDLVGASKDYEKYGGDIASFTFTAQGVTKESALKNVMAISNFFFSGGAYIDLYLLLGDYTASQVLQNSSLKEKISNAELEINDKKRRIQKLEELQKLYPVSNLDVRLPADLADSSSKYLPIKTQIIATLLDLNDSKEILLSLQTELDKNKLKKLFIEEANLIKNETYDGILLCDKLIELQKKLQAKLDKDDIHGQLIFNKLHESLTSIRIRFSNTFGVEIIGAVATKEGPTKLVVSYSTIFFCAILLILFSRHTWNRCRLLVLGEFSKSN